MGELIHSSVLNPAGYRVLERRESVFKMENGYSLETSEVRTGVAPSGKSWTRFQPVDRTFYSWKRGPIRVYRKTRLAPGRRGERSRMGPLRDFTATYLEFAKGTYTVSEGSAVIKSALRERIAEDYPLSEHFQFHSGVTPILTAETVTEACRRILGKHYQKSLPKLLGSKTEWFPENRTDALQVMMLFRGIVPTDWLPRVIEAIPAWRRDDLFSTRDELRGMRRLLRTASEAQLRRITSRELEHLPRYLREVRRDVEYRAEPLVLRDHTFGTLEELHNELAGIRRVNQHVQFDRNVRVSYTASRYDIEYTGKAKNFTGDHGNLSVISPTTSEELAEWSDYMSNCIRGYAREAAEGRTLLYAVKSGDKMVANMELDPKTGSIKQLLGRFNQSVDPAISTHIKRSIQELWPDADVDRGWQ